VAPVTRRNSASFRHAFGTLAVVALAGVSTPASRADSSLQLGTAPGRGLTATAHIDIIVTVLPSLTLSALGTGARIQANTGNLVVQRDPRDAWDGRTPTDALTLQARHLVVDTTVPSAVRPQAELLTVASP